MDTFARTAGTEGAATSHQHREGTSSNNVIAMPAAAFESKRNMCKTIRTCRWQTTLTANVFCLLFLKTSTQKKNMRYFKAIENVNCREKHIPQNRWRQHEEGLQAMLQHPKPICRDRHRHPRLQDGRKQRSCLGKHANSQDHRGHEPNRQMRAMDDPMDCCRMLRREALLGSIITIMKQNQTQMEYTHTHTLTH